MNEAVDPQFWNAAQDPESREFLDNSELVTSAAASWNPTGQSHPQSPVPVSSPVPPVTAWTAATPVPPTTSWRSGESQQPQSAPQGSSYSQNSGVAEVTPPSSNPNQPSSNRQGWIKPALVGGLIGALTSGAILGGVLASTRTTKNETSKQVTQASSSATNSASTTSPLGGTKVVPALASSAGQADVPQIVRELSKSIVTINTKGFPSSDFFGSSQVPEGAGTGIVLSKDGFVLTNAHVIADAQTIKVTIPGGKTCQADAVGRDRANDVAVVKCRNVTDFVPAALGKSGDMKVGESVVAIGNALGLEGNPTVTTGILSATNRSLEGDGERLTGLLQTDAAINPGNSGGPLVNARGQVVGMNTAIYQNTNNIGFAIPIDSILPIVEKIRSGEIGKPKTFLGVTTQTMDSDIQKQYSFGTDKGAIVTDVTVGSPAQNAGLQRGDIITKFDGVTITDNKQLGERVRVHKSGDVVDMTYLRGGQSITTKVTLGSALV
jgi:serine protease Do